jgi:hypothetical protein
MAIEGMSRRGLIAGGAIGMATLAIGSTPANADEPMVETFRPRLHGRRCPLHTALRVVLGVCLARRQQALQHEGGGRLRQSPQGLQLRNRVRPSPDPGKPQRTVRDAGIRRPPQHRNSRRAGQQRRAALGSDVRRHGPGIGARLGRRRNAVDRPTPAAAQRLSVARTQHRIRHRPKAGQRRHIRS